MILPRQNYLILSASAYSYKDKDNVQKRGCEITYIKSDNFKPVNKDDQERNSINRGIKPQTQRLDYSEVSKLNIFPGIYSADIEMQDTRDRFGNDITQMVLVNLEFVSTVTLTVDKPK